MDNNFLSAEYIELQHTAIKKLILDQRLNEAISLLAPLVETIAQAELQYKLDEIRFSYTSMLQYMQKGVEDPERHSLYMKLLAETLEINDRMKISQLANYKYNSYYRLKASYSNSHNNKNLEIIKTELETWCIDSNLDIKDNSFESDQIRKRHEDILAEMFTYIYLNTHWDKTDKLAADSFLKTSNVAGNDLCLMVSAVTMSLLICFDSLKMKWLLDAYLHTSTNVNQRALVGIAFNIHLYEERMHLYPEIRAQVNSLNEMPEFGKELNRMHIQWLFCQETEKIDKKMREEIIPEMIKNATQNLDLPLDETDDDNEDKNPDWNNNKKQSDFEDMMREVGELQQEGADVYMSSFSQLKRYPFFEILSNWFYPFDKQHSMVVNVLQEGTDPKNIVNLILDSTIFCDSDKYSLCFTLQHVPESQRQQMLSQLTEQQLNDFTDDMQILSAKKGDTQPNIVCRQYLHSLYRFFKLHQSRKEFPTIFDGRINIHRYHTLRDVLYKEEYLLPLANYYFSKEHFDKAAEVYSEIIGLAKGKADLFEKLGFCFQKQKEYDKAIEAYLKADMIHSDNVWTMRHLATCYRITKNYSNALSYYKKVESVLTENPNVTYYIGVCLAELKKYDEAINYFFKLDFMGSASIKSWRAIAWCSLANDKLEQAVIYYEKVLTMEPNYKDYLNAGHAYLCTKKIDQALSQYNKAYSTIKSKERFIELFYQDKELLLKNGIHENDIPLLIDLL